MAVATSAAGIEHSTGVTWRSARRERRAAEQHRRDVAKLDTDCRRAKHSAATAWHASPTLAGAVHAAGLLDGFVADHLKGDGDHQRIALEAMEEQGLCLLRAAREAAELQLPGAEIARFGGEASRVLARAATSDDTGVRARSTYLLTCAHLRLHDLPAAEAGIASTLRLAARHPFTKPQIERLRHGVAELRAAR